jgi:chromate transporter
MWFALHVLFGELTVIDTMGVHLTLPLARSLDPAALVLTLFAFLALFRLRWGMLPTLASTMAAGAIWRLTSG